MSDDRPADDLVAALAALRKEFDDYRATTAAQLPRRPTGDVELTLRKTPKDGTLLLQGQTLSRATYAALWRWVQEQGLLSPVVFGSGDGTTTFVLPDFRGRVPLGAGTLGADVYAVGDLVGTAKPVLTVPQLPSHTHPINGSGTHGHNGTTSTDGDHNGHWNGQLDNPPYQVTTGTNFVAPSDMNTLKGGHFHGFGTSQNGDHTHGGATAATGTGTPLDVRQPSITVNWAVWL